MKYLINSCPKCHGTPSKVEEMYEIYWKCMMCGHEETIKNINPMKKKEEKQMEWYAIGGTNARIRKGIKDLQGASILVQDTSKGIYVKIPESEKGWLDKICNDLGLNCVPCVAPEYFQADCGKLTTNPARHKMACRSCLALRGITEVKKPVKHIHEGDGKSQTLFKLPGLPDFSLDGLISYLQGRRDEALNIAQEIDTTVSNLTKMKEIENTLSTILNEREEIKKALDYFLKKNG